MIKLTLKSLAPALILAAALPLFAADTNVAVKEKTYILASKDHSSLVGKVLQESTDMAMKEGKMQIHFQGQAMDGSMDMKEAELKKWEFLTADKRRYTLVKSEAKQKMVMMGQPTPMPNEVHALLVKPVIFTKKEGKWIGALEEGDATQKEQGEIKKIEEELAKDNDFKIYGDQARKIGDEWQVDGADIFSMEDVMGVDAKLKMKFIKVEKFQDTQCAVFEATFTLKGQMEEMAGMSMDIELTGTIHRSIIDHVDLSAQMTGAMNLQGKMEPQPGLALDMNMKGPMTMTSKINVTRP